MQPRRRLTAKLALVFFAPFVLLLAFVFFLDWRANQGHAWVRIEDEAIYRYVPAGARLASSSHSGWTFRRTAPRNRAANTPIRS